MMMHSVGIEEYEKALIRCITQRCTLAVAQEGSLLPVIDHRTEETAMTTTKVVMAMIAGVATGALPGILFAPGSVTRRKLKHREGRGVLPGKACASPA